VDSQGDIVTAAHVATPTADELKLTLVTLYIIADVCTPASDCSAVIRRRQGELLASSSVEDAHVGVRILSQDTHMAAGSTAADAYGAAQEARVLASSPSTSRDVAVLHVARTATPAVLLRPTPAAPQMPVAVIGFPPAGTFTVPPTFTYGSAVSLGHGTSGIGLPRDATAANLAGDATVVRIDALAEHGDSGGPTVDEAGQVVGLLSFGADPQGPVRAAFLISADDIHTVLDQAGVVNRLGVGDEQWRSGLEAFDRGDMVAALAGFHACEQSAPSNAGCREWDAMAVSRQQDGGGGHGLLLAIAAAALAVSAILGLLLTWVVRRRRRTAQRRRLFGL